MNLLKLSLFLVLNLFVTATANSTPRIEEFLQPGRIKKNLGVVVAGGSRGIGLGFVRFYLENGADALILSQGSANQHAQELQKEFPNQKVLGVQVDLSDSRSVRQAVQNSTVQKFFSRAQVLINSAGTAVLDPNSKRGAAEKREAEKAWNQMMAIKTQGAQALSEAFLQANQNEAFILQVSSVAAIYQFPFPGKGYSQSNWKLVELADQIHRQHSDRVISWAMAPGIVATDMTQNHFPLPAPVLERWGDSVESLIYSAVDTLLNPERELERFVRPQHRIFVPGKEVNLQLIEAFDHGQRYLKEENMQDYLETLVQIQLNTSHWRNSQITERLNLVENWVQWINQTNRAMGFMPLSMSTTSLTKKQQVLQAGLGLCSRALYHTFGKRFLKGMSD